MPYPLELQDAQNLRQSWHQPVHGSYISPSKILGKFKNLLKSLKAWTKVNKTYSKQPDGVDRELIVFGVPHGCVSSLLVGSECRCVVPKLVVKLIEVLGVECRNIEALPDGI